MKIQFYSLLPENFHNANRKRVELEVPQDITVGQFLKMQNIVLDQNYTVIVNRKRADLSDILSENATVQCIPLIAGG